jgi:hypothetical protein
MDEPSAGSLLILARPSYRGEFLTLLTNHKVVAAVAIVGLLVGFWQLYQHWDDARHSAMAGYLTAGQRGEWQLIIAGGGIPFAFRTADGVIFRDGNRPPLSARKKAVRKGVFFTEQQWVFSLPVRDKDGKLIAEIQNNEWSVQPSEKFDRNYTDHLLEVKDAYGQVVLQAVDLGDALYFIGTLRCHDGKKVSFVHGPDGGGKIDFSNTEEPQFPLKPLCKYPSDRHLGECASRESISQFHINDPNGKAYFITKALDLCPTSQPPQ